MALRDFPFAKDILLNSKDEFEYWKDSPNHVVGRANREGKLVLSDRSGRGQLKLDTTTQRSCGTSQSGQSQTGVVFVKQSIE